MPRLASTHPPAVADRGVRPMLLSAWLVTAVFVLSNSPTPLYVHWQRRLGFSAGMLTVIFAAYIAGLLITLTVAGQVADRFGRKPVLLPGLVAASAACVLFLNASTVAELVIARFLTGVAVGVTVSAGMATVVDQGGPARHRQAALTASVAMVLGAGLGPLLAGLAAQWLAAPVPVVFTVEFLLLASALIVVAVLKVPLPNSRTDRFRLHLPSVPHGNGRHVAYGIAIFAPGITGTSFVLSLGPSLLSRLLHVTSPLVAGGTACVMFLTATGTQFAVARRPVRTILLLGATATVAAMISLVIAVHASVAPALILAAILAGAGQGPDVPHFSIAFCSPLQRWSARPAAAWSSCGGGALAEHDLAGVG